MDEFDKRVVNKIIDILWKHHCTFDEDNIDWDYRIINDIDCPEEEEAAVALELDEELEKLYNQRDAEEALIKDFG